MPDLRNYSLHLPHFHVDDTKDLRLLYGIRIIRDVVFQFCFFFYPIFLYNFAIESGLLSFLHLNDVSTGMLGIALYFLLTRLLMFFIAIPIGTIIQKKGLSTGLRSAFLARSLQLTMLMYSGSFPWLILLVIMFEALQSHFFWNSYYTILSRFTLQKNLGKDLSLQQFFLQLITTLTPAISGLLILQSGFETVFLIGLTLSIFGVILTLHTHFPIVQDTLSLKEFFQWLKEKQYELFAFSFPGKYINDSVHFLWPLYVFFFLGSIEKVGYLYSTSLFIALLFTFIFGAFVDKSSSKKPFFASAGFLSLFWIFRTQVWSPLGIALIDAFERLTAGFHWLFFDKLFIKRASGNRALAYFVYSEIILSIFGSFFWLIIAILFLLNIGWNAIFIVAAIGVLASVFISDKHSEIKTV